MHVNALLNLLSKLPSQYLLLANIDEGPAGPHRDPASPFRSHSHAKADTVWACAQVDDDSYVHVDALLNLLSKLPSQHLFLGNIDEGPGGPHRDPASPWYVTEEEWATEHYPLWAHGAGYVLSKVRSPFLAQALTVRIHLFFPRHIPP